MTVVATGRISRLGFSWFEENKITLPSAKESRISDKISQKFRQYRNVDQHVYLGRVMVTMLHASVRVVWE